jgi:signal transduction histidine kinase/ligand-binding sensor domain-containing protein/CheY-like chemotaxis protein
MTARRILAFITLALLAAVAPAQHYTFKTFGGSEGLTSPAVRCIFQDHTGFLWVGTSNGLFRYDGARFTRFGKNDGLPSTRIAALQQTPDGVIWVATQKGLARLTGSRFEPIAIAAKITFLSASVLALQPASGSLFVATAQGLFVGSSHPADSAPLFAPALRGPLAKAPVRMVYVDRHATVWFAAGGKIYRLAGTGPVALQGREPPAAVWSAMLVDSQENLWLRSPRRLVVRWHGTDRFVAADRSVPPSDGEEPSLIEHAGRLMVPTSLGLAVRSGEAWSLLNESHGLAADSVATAFEDREGSIWLGLSGSGVTRWNGVDEWESWTKQEGLRNEHARAIAEDVFGAVWTGTNSGVYRLARRAGRWIEHPAFRGQRVQSMLADRYGGIWVGRVTGGLTRIDARTGETRHYGAAAGLPDEGVTAIAADAEGRLLVTAESCVYRCSKPGEKIRFQPLRPPWSNHDESFSRTLPARDGSLWIGSGRGLTRLANGAWKLFSKADGLADKRVAYVAQTPDNALWIGYRDDLGLTRLTFAGLQLQMQHIAGPPALGSDKIRFLDVDSRGWLWAGTDNGVDRFDGAAWRHFGRPQGLIWDYCNSNAFLVAADGSVWVGTTDGVSHFRPAAEPLRDRPPNVALTAVRLGSRTLTPGVRRIVPYANQVLEAEFTALTFVDESQVRFRYRLLPLEDRWVETRERSARYVELPAGEYEFQVQARSARGVWSTTAATAAFQILPAWWQTWWVRLVALAVTVLAGWQWLHWRFRGLTNERSRLEQAVLTRTRDLEEQKRRAEEANRCKSDFLANMSHEIRTPLQGVLGMQDLALQGSLDASQRDSIETAQQSAKSLLFLLNDILDFSRIEANRFELDRVDFSLRQCVHAAIHTLAVAARSKGIALAGWISPSLPDALQGDPARLRQVLLNLIGNAIKFTENGSVTVNVVPEPGPEAEVWIHATVHDTGIGIPPDKQGLIFEAFRQVDASISRKYGGTGLGLSISAKLIGLMGGRVWLESQPGAGSTFHFLARFERAATLDEFPAEPSPLASPPVPLRILLAEDNVVNQKVAAGLLRRDGHSVEVVGNGREAVDRLEGQQFDLVLMDMHMPVMDGLEAARSIRALEKKNGGHTVILALTADAIKGARERCLEAGMDGYVTKPITYEEIRAAVGQYVKA